MSIINNAFGIFMFLLWTVCEIFIPEPRKNVIMKQKFGALLIAVILAIASGCQSGRESSNSTFLAIINVWSMPGEPALTFQVRSDNSLVLLKTVRKKNSLYRFRLSPESKDRLLNLANSAHVEIQQTRINEAVCDGTGISVSLGHDFQHAATIRHYAQRVYKLKYVPALLDQLKSIVPPEYWWD